MLQVIVDRVQLDGVISAQRLTDSIETAYRGRRRRCLRACEIAPGRRAAARAPRVQRALRVPPAAASRYEDPQPRLFSFNNPFGACPTCHGFGNIIELDMDLVVPDPTKSITPGRHRAVDASRTTRRSSRI